MRRSAFTPVVLISGLGFAAGKHHSLSVDRDENLNHPGTQPVLAAALLVSMAVFSLFPKCVLAQSAPVTADHPWHGPGEQKIPTDTQKLPDTRFSIDPAKIYSLAELIDLAESHNPETRVAWERARGQAAALGIARSELYPTLAATALSGVSRDEVYLTTRFEFGASRDRDLLLRKRIREWQPQLRTLFLMRIALWKYRVQLPGFELPEPVRAAQLEFNYKAASVLDDIADRFEGKASRQQDNLQNSFEQLQHTIRNCLPLGTQQLRTAPQTFLTLSRNIESLTTSLNKVI